jgi:hypothetical protein
MNRLFILVLVVIVLGCSREKNLTGEIFIVTQGGQNYKLGLVSVNLISQDKIKTHLGKKAKIANQNIAPIYNDYKQLKDSIDKLTVTAEEFDKKVQLLKSYDKNNELLSALKRSLSVAEKKLDLMTKAAPLEKVILLYADGSFFFDGLPGSIDSTKTDSDGRFRFVVQKESKYYIVAKATRNIGDKKEYYYWIVEYPNPSFREDDKILLSNDNLFDPLKILDLGNSQVQKQTKL